MTTSTKILLVVVAAGVGFLLMQLFLHLPGGAPLTPEQRQAQINEMVDGVKSTLPRKVHPNVTWFDVKAEKDRIVYLYKIHAPRATVMSRRTQMEADLKKSTMAWLAKAAMPSGVGIKCELYDENQSFLYGIVLD